MNRITLQQNLVSSTHTHEQRIIFVLHYSRLVNASCLIAHCNFSFVVNPIYCENGMRHNCAIRQQKFGASLAVIFRGIIERETPAKICGQRSAIEASLQFRFFEAESSSHTANRFACYVCVEVEFILYFSVQIAGVVSERMLNRRTSTCWNRYRVKWLACNLVKNLPSFNGWQRMSCFVH